MNKRTSIIVAAIAMPIAILAVLTGGHSHSPDNVPPGHGNAMHNPAAGLEQARQHVRDRLAYLQKLTPDQWPEERRKNPGIAPTLEVALANNKKHLAELEAMTPQQWANQHRQPNRQPPMQQKPAVGNPPPPAPVGAQ